MIFLSPFPPFVIGVSPAADFFLPVEKNMDLENSFTAIKCQDEFGVGSEGFSAATFLKVTRSYGAG